MSLLFLWRENVIVEHEELGQIHTDIAYGGNFYAIIDPQKTFQDYRIIRQMKLYD